MRRYDSERSKMERPEEIEDLYLAHVRRYSRMLEAARSGASGYNLPELEWLLSLWAEAKAKGFRIELLEADALCEVSEAIDDKLGERGIYGDEPDPDDEGGEPIVGTYQGRASNRPFN